MREDQITASDIKAALSVKYCPPEWCVYFEVADQSGGYTKRYADAVAMSIWPSRGYQIHGFEIKVSRSDFLSEMKQPEKSDPVSKYCDHWWLVTPPKLVDAAELPTNWGLMVLQKNGLRIKKQAPKTRAESLDRGFAAALLRRSIDLQQAHIRRMVDQGEADRERELQRRVEAKTKHIAEEQRKNREWIEKFERELGISFATWRTPEQFAQRLKLAETMTDEYADGSLQRLHRGCQNLVEALEVFQESQP
jgi:hypothetical protein